MPERCRQPLLAGRREKQPHPRDETVGDAVVIAVLVVVRAADAHVEARDEPRDLAIDVDIGPLGQQIEAGGKVRLVGPFLAP